uniref:Uncharacterized protein n=1 Tax=Arundo donax TaxID=35708 RepID=A0A0A9DRS4_ARUDO
MQNASEQSHQQISLPVTNLSSAYHSQFRRCSTEHKGGPYFPLPFSVQTLSHELLAFDASNCWPGPSNNGASAPLTPPFFGFVLIPSKRKTNLASSP